MIKGILPARNSFRAILSGSDSFPTDTCIGGTRISAKPESHHAEFVPTAYLHWCIHADLKRSCSQNACSFIFCHVWRCVALFLPSLFTSGLCSICTESAGVSLRACGGPDLLDTGKTTRRATNNTCAARTDLVP
jgi:hypothetical protein